MRSIIQRLLILLIPAALAAQTSICDWSGTWSTNWGSMQLTQVGDSVWGTYTHDGGRINGKVTGNTLAGLWTEAPTYSVGSDGGKISFTLSADCKSFAGGWRYGVDGNDLPGGWTGTRQGFSATGRIVSSGKGVAGVAVRAGSAMAVTDANGYFSLNGLPNGTHTITMEKQGYTFSPTSVAISITDANTTSILVNASAGGSNDQPGDGCNITIHTEDRGYVHDYYPSILTGTNGVATARTSSGKLYAHYSIEPGYCYIRKSTDNGATWSNPVRTEAEPNASGTNTMLIGKDGTIHFADQFNVGTYYKRSTDDGQTWTDAYFLHDQGWGDWDYSAQIAFDGSDRLHAVYFAAFGWSDPPYNIKWRYSNDQGVTWEAEQSLTSIPNDNAESQGAHSPALAAGPGNRLYAVYLRQFADAPATRYKLRMLSYNGTSWDNGIDITDDHFILGGHDVVVDPSGVVHIIYAYGTSEGVGWTSTIAYRTVTNGVVSAERVLVSNFEHVWATSLGFVAGDLMLMIGKANTETKRGYGVYAFNISGNWQCPVMVSKTTEAAIPNIPWTFNDVRPAGNTDVTWVEVDGTTTSLVLCDGSTFEPRPCGGAVSEEPEDVVSDSIAVILSQIVTDAVGYPDDFPVIDLNVAVAESSHGMLGDLTRQNFTVFENDVEQQFSFERVGEESFDTTEPAAIVIAIDNSSSTPDSVRAAIIELVTSLKDNMKPQWQIAVLKYADRVQKMVDFTNDADELLEGLIPSGPMSDQAVIMTAVTEAINMCAQRTEKYRAVMVLTSGLISDPQYTSFATQQAASKSIPVYILGVTDTKADPSLRALADRSGGRMFTTDDDLDAVDDETAGTLGNAYRFRYTTTNGKRDGSIRNVKVALRAPLQNSPQTIIYESDAKNYRAPVDNSKTIVTFEPKRATLPPSTTTANVTIAVWVENITDPKGLMGAEVVVEFDPSVVQFVGSRPGEFLSPPPTDILSDLTNTSQADQGTITINIVRVGGNPPGVQGTGPLYYLSFRAKTADAASAIKITELNLRNAQNMPISSQSFDGELVSLTAPNGPGAGVGNVFTNFNSNDPSDGSAQPPHFTLTEPYVITKVTTLHAGGKNPGQISIKNDMTGQTYGPWNASASSYGGVSNGLWVSSNEVTLPAGTYVVIDSDPPSWTFNDASDMRGIVWIDGRKQTPSKPADHRGTLLGDFDGNNLVNFPDYTLFVSYWNAPSVNGDIASPIIGEPPGVPPFTIETYPYRGEGSVDFEDQIVFAQMYNWTRGFGKVIDMSDSPLEELRLRAIDRRLPGLERELVLNVNDVNYLLGMRFVVNGNEATLRSLRVELDPWILEQAPQAHVLIKPHGSGLLVTIIGMGSPTGIMGSGAMLHMRYSPATVADRIGIADTEGRDIGNRSMVLITNEEEDSRPPIILMPIPAIDELHVIASTGRSGPMTMTVVNTTGQHVGTWMAGETVDHVLDRVFDVRSLPSGVYTLRIEQEDLKTAILFPIVR